MEVWGTNVRRGQQGTTYGAANVGVWGGFKGPRVLDIPR